METPGKGHPALAAAGMSKVSSAPGPTPKGRRRGVILQSIGFSSLKYGQQGQALGDGLVPFWILPP